MEEKIIKALAQYGFKANEIKHLTAYGDGLINHTYRFYVGDTAYLIQRINTAVFKNPEGLMDNFVAVTEYLKEKIRAKPLILFKLFQSLLHLLFVKTTDTL